MLTISRSVLRRFRTLCRRGGLHKSPVAGGPVVTFVGGADGCRIRAASTDVAIEYHEPGDRPPETIRLPLAALEALRGARRRPRHDRRRLRRSSSALVDRSRRASRERAGATEAWGTSFPAAPTTSVANGSELWTALGDAVATTDPQSSRYALGCLHLRGALGRIETTDGRQVLVQSGYRFGFEDDVLIPGSKLLGSADFANGESIAVGRTEDYVGFGVGRWLILLRIQKDARFPKIDQILPNPDAAKSRLEFSPVRCGLLEGDDPAVAVRRHAARPDHARLERPRARAESGDDGESSDRSLARLLEAHRRAGHLEHQPSLRRASAQARLPQRLPLRSRFPGDVRRRASPLPLGLAR